MMTILRFASIFVSPACPTLRGRLRTLTNACERLRTLANACERFRTLSDACVHKRNDLA